MKRRPRGHFFKPVVRDALNAIGVFILLAIALQVLNSFGVNP